MGKYKIFKRFLRKCNCCKVYEEKHAYEEISNENSFHMQLDNYECSVNMENVRPQLWQFIQNKVIATADDLVIDLAKDCTRKALYDPNMDRMQEAWREIHPREKLPLLSSSDYTVITSGGKPVVIRFGNQGKVILAKENQTQDLVVIKISDYNKDAVDLVVEFGMQNIAHDVLYGCIGAPVFRGFLQVLRSSPLSNERNFRYLPVCEFCPVVPQLPFSLTMQQALDEHKNGRSLITRDEWISIIHELLKAQKTFERNNICHLDLNLNNVLILFMEDRVFPIIIDYGCSRMLNSKNKSGEPIITASVFDTKLHHPHTAPELFELDHPLPTSDLYSIAYIVSCINQDILHCERLLWELRNYLNSKPHERYTHLTFKIKFHLEMDDN